MGRQSAEHDPVALATDEPEIREPSDVDDHLRLCEAELHRRQQAVAAGQELRVIAVPGEQSQRFVERRGPDVVERGGNHFLAPFFTSLPMTGRDAAS